jgi:hypothetical protein
MEISQTKKVRRWNPFKKLGGRKKQAAAFDKKMGLEPDFDLGSEISSVHSDINSSSYSKATQRTQAFSEMEWTSDGSSPRFYDHTLDEDIVGFPGEDTLAQVKRVLDLKDDDTQATHHGTYDTYESESGMEAVFVPRCLDDRSTHADDDDDGDENKELRKESTNHDDDKNKQPRKESTSDGDDQYKQLRDEITNEDDDEDKGLRKENTNDGEEIGRQISQVTQVLDRMTAIECRVSQVEDSEGMLMPALAHSQESDVNDAETNKVVDRRGPRGQIQYRYSEDETIKIESERFNAIVKDHIISQTNYRGKILAERESDDMKFQRRGRSGPICYLDEDDDAEDSSSSEDTDSDSSSSMSSVAELLYSSVTEGSFAESEQNSTANFEDKGGSCCFISNTDYS